MDRKALSAAAAALFTLCGSAHAQDWPARAITMTVPPAARPAVADVSARIQAQGMSERLGQPIVVENMGGAGGMTGALRVAKADPDGYTMLIGNSGTQAYSQLQPQVALLHNPSQTSRPARASDRIAAHP